MNEKPKEILIVTSLSGKDLLKCPKCKEKWFDSWYSFDGKRICIECGDKMLHEWGVFKRG